MLEPGEHHAKLDVRRQRGRDWGCVLQDHTLHDVVDCWFSDDPQEKDQIVLLYRNLLDWNLPAVTNMTAAFQGRAAFDEDLSAWDVSSVAVISAMFQNAATFDRSLSAWDVSSVTDASNMFNGASAFQMCSAN